MDYWSTALNNNLAGKVSTYVVIYLFVVLFFGGIIVFEKVSGLFKKLLKLKDNSLFKRLFTFGYGGSADWANVIEYEGKEPHIDDLEPYTKGVFSYDPILGRTLFQDDPFPRLVGVKDDAHLITIGMTGSGKSTSVLKPNLALLKKSIFIYDPKAELAKATLRRRCAKSYKGRIKVEGKTLIEMSGHMTFLLDPFKETRDEFEYYTFNPMALIDINDDRCMELISAISDGCVLPPSDSKDEHFTDNAKNMIEAVIIHVISRYPKENHNLPFVLDLISGSAEFYYDVPDEAQIDRFQELLIDMMTNDAVGGLPKQVSSRIMGMGENEKGSVLSTTFRCLKWVGDPAMRKQLVSSENFQILKGCQLTDFGDKTVYIVLHPDLVKAQMRWLRVLTNVFIYTEKKRKEKSKVDSTTLFILDEFYQLGGRLDSITKGFPFLRSYNIKLWLFFQSLSQLKESFGDAWTDVVSASNTQILGVNDPETAEWVSKRLGSRRNKTIKKEKWYSHGEVIKERIDPLLSIDEVESELGKNTELQIVFPVQGRPMRLERITYKPLPFGRSLDSIGYSLKGHFEDYPFTE